MRPKPKVGDIVRSRGRLVEVTAYRSARDLEGRILYTVPDDGYIFTQDHPWYIGYGGSGWPYQVLSSEEADYHRLRLRLDGRG